MARYTITALRAYVARVNRVLCTDYKISEAYGGSKIVVEESGHIKKEITHGYALSRETAMSFKEYLRAEVDMTMEQWFEVTNI